MRAYVGIFAFRHLGFAFAFAEDEYRLGSSPSFRYVFEVAAVHTWAGIFAGLGILGIGALVWPREIGIRSLLAVSVGTSLAFAGGSILAIANQPPLATSLVPIAFAVFAAKDLIVSGMAFTNPVEEMIRETEYHDRACS